jgi:hypothetical protein
MCCSVTTGSGASYDLCAPGYSYIPGPGPGDPGSCVNYVAGGVLCEADVVEFKTGCQDGGDDPDCDENPDDPNCAPCDPSTNPNGCPPDGGTDPNCPNGGTWTCENNKCGCR